jgi:hypothetical protein
VSDEAPPELEPETHFLVNAPVGWAGGYVIRCGVCGAASGWRLSVYPDPDPGHVPADVADLTCPEGHTQEHPLIYPEMVRMLYAASPSRTPDDQEAAAALSAINWRPHNRVVRRDTVTYLPWEYKPGPNRIRWPDLVWVYQGGTLPRPPGQ